MMSRRTLVKTKGHKGMFVMKINEATLRLGLIAIILMIVVVSLGAGPFMMRKAERDNSVAKQFLAENYPRFSPTGGEYGPIAWRKSSHIFRGSMDSSEVEIEIVVDRGRVELKGIRHR